MAGETNVEIIRWNKGSKPVPVWKGTISKGIRFDRVHPNWMGLDNCILTLSFDVPVTVTHCADEKSFDLEVGPVGEDEN